MPVCAVSDLENAEVLETEVELDGGKPLVLRQEPKLLRATRTLGVQKLRL